MPPLYLVTILLKILQYLTILFIVKCKLSAGPGEPALHDLTSGHHPDIRSPPFPLPWLCVCSSLGAFALAFPRLGILLHCCFMWLPPAPFFRSLSSFGSLLWQSYYKSQYSLLNTHSFYPFHALFLFIAFWTWHLNILPIKINRQLSSLKSGLHECRYLSFLFFFLMAMLST